MKHKTVSGARNELSRLRSCMNLSESDLAQMFQVTTATIRRWEHQEELRLRIRPASAERFRGIELMMAYLKGTLSQDEARDWIRTPIGKLEDLTPLELIRAGRVLDLCYYLESVDLDGGY